MHVRSQGSTGIEKHCLVSIQRIENEQQLIGLSIYWGDRLLAIIILDVSSLYLDERIINDANDEFCWSMFWPPGPNGKLEFEDWSWDDGLFEGFCNPAPPPLWLWWCWIKCWAWMKSNGSIIPWGGRFDCENESWFNWPWPWNPAKFKGLLLPELFIPISPNCWPLLRCRDWFSLSSSSLLEFPPCPADDDLRCCCCTWELLLADSLCSLSIFLRSSSMSPKGILSSLFSRVSSSVTSMSSFSECSEVEESSAFLCLPTFILLIMVGGGLGLERLFSSLLHDTGDRWLRSFSGASREATSNWRFRLNIRVWLTEWRWLGWWWWWPVGGFWLKLAAAAAVRPNRVAGSKPGPGGDPARFMGFPMWPTPPWLRGWWGWCHIGGGDEGGGLKIQCDG